MTDSLFVRILTADTSRHAGGESDGGCEARQRVKRPPRTFHPRLCLVSPRADRVVQSGGQVVRLGGTDWDVDGDWEQG